MFPYRLSAIDNSKSITVFNKMASLLCIRLFLLILQIIAPLYKYKINMLKSDNIVSSKQYLIARLLCWFMIFILGIRYFQIQIIEHELYRLKSNTNRIRRLQKRSRGYSNERRNSIDNYPVYVITAILAKCQIKRSSSN